jgi:ribonuclease P protein component
VNRNYCLKGRKNFEMLFKGGIRLRSGNFQLVLLRAGQTVPEKGDYPKIGIMVSRRFGKAHDRNKIKRRIRSILHEYLPRVRKEAVMVVRANDWSNKLSYSEMSHEIGALLRKSMLLEEGKI